MVSHLEMCLINLHLLVFLTIISLFQCVHTEKLKQKISVADEKLINFKYTIIYSCLYCCPIYITRINQ